jgi:uncharacterized protein (TIGR03086 family)
MSADAERYERVAHGFTERIVTVGADQWSMATPCTEWTVRDLVAHVVNTNRRVLATFDGSEPVPVEADGDLVAQWQEATGALLSVVSTPSSGATLVTSLGGHEVPFESMVGGLACTDTMIHTWDLARATGQSEQLDPEAVVHCQATLEGFGDGIRRPGGFGDLIPSPPGADAQTKFLHFAGRAV